MSPREPVHVNLPFPLKEEHSISKQVPPSELHATAFTTPGTLIVLGLLFINNSLSQFI